MLSNLAGLGGVAAIFGTAYFASMNRSAIKWRYIFTAFAMHILLSLFVLKTSFGQSLFSILARGVEALQACAGEGASFVFGALADSTGPWGFIFAFKVGSLIIFFSALMSVLFHLGILQRVVAGIAYVIRPVLGTSGAESLCVVANTVIGQTESPLLIKHYIAKMSDSQVLLIMISGMSTISGSILAVYASLGIEAVHLLTSSVISIPAAILISKMLLPDTDDVVDNVVDAGTASTSNVLDAIFVGTTDGLRLALNVIAMLIAFIGLIAMVNGLTLYVTKMIYGTGFSFDQILGWLFSGVAYLIGIPLHESVASGAILGKKLVINEFLGYSDLLASTLCTRSKIIMTYALCGFANFSSIGIQIGGIGVLVPSKRQTLTRLGLRALLGGTLVNLLNAALIGLLL